MCQEFWTEYRVNERVVRLQTQIPETADLFEDGLRKEVILAVEVAIILFPLLTSNTESVQKYEFSLNFQFSK